MSATYTVARQEMFDLFKTEFAAPALVLCGYAPEIREQGKEIGFKPPVDKFWLRLSTKNVSGSMTAFIASEDVGQSPKEFTNFGLMFVQIFAPMSEAEGFDVGGKLGEVAKAIFQNAETSSSVWFRNAALNELNSDGKWYPFNVVVEYQFDEQV